MILGRRYTTKAICQSFNSRDKQVNEFELIIDGKASESKIARVARLYCKSHSTKGKDGVKFTFLQVTSKTYNYERFGMDEEKFFSEATLLPNENTDNN